MLTGTPPRIGDPGGTLSRERPIRIARVIARLNIGGPAQHVILLTIGMDRARFRTTLITGMVGRGEGDLSSMAQAQGVEPIVIPALRPAIRPMRDVVALGALVRLFRHLRPDIVHTHTAKAGTLGRLAARLAGVPRLVHTFHGHVLDGYFSPGATAFFLRVERALARGTDRIITVSPRLRDALLAMGIGRPEQVEVVPLGLDLDRFVRMRRERGDLRPSLGIPAEVPLLGIVGRLVPIKDHPTLLRALTLLPDGNQAPHLLVVGDGGRREELRQLTHHLGLTSRVHYLGWRDDLEAILGELDMVICCSRNEGTPVALIEAMAAGVPVISTDVGGVGDLVTHGETGWLVPPGDSVALARGIEILLSDPGLCRRLATTARPLALERYHIQGLIRRMEMVYAEVLTGKRSQ